MIKRQKIVILGSTGSIGRSCLNIIRRYTELYDVVGLACGENVTLLSEQIAEFSPTYVYCKNADLVKGDVKILPSLLAMSTIEEADSVLFATVGFSSAEAVVGAIVAGKKILLANKETLVCAGSVIMPLVKKHNAVLLPVDSEHSAVFQLCHGECNREIKNILLTASGGAFRDYTHEQLKTVTYRDALKHPNWAMGAKITIDCASLVNKALEVIEAHYLFDLPYENIKAVLHRQSIIHSMIELCDSTVLAQMSYPTMEIPISLALSYPKRMETTVQPLNLFELKSLDFEELDRQKFPCFDIVVESGKRGGLYPTALSAANEILVDAFLHDKVEFLSFYSVLEKVMAKTKNIECPTLTDILELDKETRKIVKELIK